MKTEWKGKLFVGILGQAPSSQATHDTKAYEQYKNSLDALVSKSGINLKSLKVDDIFNQLKLNDKNLWNITKATFRRDVWPRYRKENDLKKQPGRPRKK